MKKNGNLKVNLHLIEACNYKCRHCFAHFDKHKVLDKEQWQKIIYNTVDSGMVSSFNFAGGEPLLYPHLTSLAEYAVSLGSLTVVVSSATYGLSSEIRPQPVSIADMSMIEMIFFTVSTFFQLPLYHTTFQKSIPKLIFLLFHLYAPTDFRQCSHRHFGFRLVKFLTFVFIFGQILYLDTFVLSLRKCLVVLVEYSLSQSLT